MTSYTSGAAFDKDGNKVQEFNGGGDHFGNFSRPCAAASPRTSTPTSRRATSPAPCATWATSRTAWASSCRSPKSKSGCKNVKSAEHVVETLRALQRHLADNKLDLETHEAGATA